MMPRPEGAVEISNMLATSEKPTEKMLARKDGPVGWMIFNNPERLNAVGVEMWEAIPKILDDFEADPEIRVIVLRGAGEKAFISGADISQFEKHRSSPEAVQKYEEIGETAQRRLTYAEKPTLSMIRGYCIGGGVGVALTTDLRIAGAGARFGVPAARLGLGYRASGIKKLMDVVGPANAKEIFYTARHFTADEALGMGLINRVVPDDELEAYVADYCRRIAENAPLTIMAAKKTIAELSKPSKETDRDYCDELVRGCFASEDYTEGRKAFMEKRKPVFRGR